MLRKNPFLVKGVQPPISKSLDVFFNIDIVCLNSLLYGAGMFNWKIFQGLKGQPDQEQVGGLEILEKSFNDIGCVDKYIFCFDSTCIDNIDQLFFFGIGFLSHNHGHGRNFFGVDDGYGFLF